jgi:hypothetical protein
MGLVILITAIYGGTLLLILYFIYSRICRHKWHYSKFSLNKQRNNANIIVVREVKICKKCEKKEITRYEHKPTDWNTFPKY